MFPTVFETQDDA